MFLGTTFFSGKHTLLSPATNILNVKKLSITDGIYDHLFFSSNPTKNVDNINDEWTYDTKLNADFESDLEGGNTSFSTRNTDLMIIKTREVGTLEWKTIYTIPINKDDDFNFTINYPYSKNYSNNEYMLLSTINGVENSYVITECSTLFDGFFVVDKDNIYGTMYNIDITDTTQNINNSVIELLNNIYPTVFTNSNANYITGSTSGCFIRLDAQNSYVDIRGGINYRKDVMTWLCNGQAKILKLEDGRIYLIKVTGKPTDSNIGHRDLRKISFEWTEIGDVDNCKDLYFNNLSDVETQWW